MKTYLYNIHNWQKCLARPIYNFIDVYSSSELETGRIWEYENAYKNCEMFVDGNENYKNFICLVLKNHVMVNKILPSYFYIEQCLIVRPIVNFDDPLNPYPGRFDPSLKYFKDSWDIQFAEQIVYILPIKNDSNKFEIVSSIKFKENVPFFFNDNFFIFDRLKSLDLLY